MREAHVRVDDDELDAMGIAELVALSRAAGLRDFEELVCRGNGGTVRVDVDDRLDEAALSELDCVDDWERVSGDEDGYSYVVAFTAPALPATLVDATDDLLGTCDPEVGEDGTTLTFVGPQDAISEAVRGYEDAGVSPDLERLGAYGGPGDALDSLTERQEEVVRTAFDLGYYDVPRTASTDVVAAELGLDSSTVSEHLQRAERNVLAEHL